ncbi:hypothetical protein ACFFWC_01520 [Plantactinospora siamensis]|uniref:Secreted protein n=1 Tax=Plantactinospora siamensis TaxID=555372 RepID=A0ABV6NT69_9ACTN
MARIFRRKATMVAVGALAVALLGGGVAAAAPNGNSGPARVAQPGGGAKLGAGAFVQPPVSKAEAVAAKAALAPAAADELLPPTSARTEWAVVESNGSLVRGFHAVSAQRFSTGLYEVIFNHNVRRAAYVATTGFTGSEFIPPPGTAVTVGRTGIPNGVFIAVYDQNGALVDRAFHLAVHS